MLSTALRHWSTVVVQILNLYVGVFMDSLKLSIDKVESFIGDKGAMSDTWAAWTSIKKKLAEVQNPPDNTGSPKLLALADYSISALSNGNLDACKDFLFKLRKQLRAGA
jgi:hypothetical protein